MFSILIHGVVLETVDNWLRLQPFTPPPPPKIKSTERIHPIQYGPQKISDKHCCSCWSKIEFSFPGIHGYFTFGARASLRLKSTSDKHWANVKPNQIFLCMLKITVGSSLLQDEILSIKIAIWPCMMAQIYNIHSREMKAEGSEFQTTVGHRVSSRLDTSNAPVSKD